MKKEKDQGFISSSVIADKKKIIADFYERNCKRYEELTNAFFSGAVKSGIAMVVNVLAFKLAEQNNMELAAGLFKIGSFASISIASIIGLCAIALDILNRKLSKKQYQIFVETVKEMEREIDGRIIFPDATDHLSRVRQFIYGMGMVYDGKKNFPSLYLMDEEFDGVIVCDDFVDRIVDLDEVMMSVEYAEKKADSELLYTIFKQYAIWIQSEKKDANIFEQLNSELSSLESKIAKLAGPTLTKKRDE